VQVAGSTSSPAFGRSVGAAPDAHEVDAVARRDRAGPGARGRGEQRVGEGPPEDGLDLGRYAFESFDASAGVTALTLAPSPEPR